VEGPRDKSFFTSYCNESNLRKVAIYPIEAVEVQPLSVQLGGGGNSGRLLALGQLLNDVLGSDCYAARCLVDRDFFGILYAVPESPYIWLTDLSCLEAYALNLAVLRRLWAVYFMRPISDDRLLSFLQAVKDVFAVRAAKRVLHWQSPWLAEIAREASLDGEIMIWNRNSFVGKLAAKSEGAFTAVQLLESVDQLVPKLIGETGMYVNAHDALQLLGWLGRQSGAHHHLCNDQPLHGALLGFVERDEIEVYRLFQNLIEWAQ
jgi:hypothetical protein